VEDCFFAMRAYFITPLYKTYIISAGHAGGAFAFPVLRPSFQGFTALEPGFFSLLVLPVFSEDTEAVAVFAFSYVEGILTGET
jgi:hypothetical protein